ncbi:MAG: ribosome biogenesis GTPase Der [Eubacteriales bacterium]|jgi:GTP-binding protein|nr:ribosome biogenesis GTPase Der [Eubacteriales bacterium]
MSNPIIAIVGRPNVGKSTFFNKLAGTRVSIVEDTPGVTRDRIYYDIEWGGRTLTLIDTGGIEPNTDDFLLRHMRLQAQIAIDTADVIIFLTDVTTGITANDREISLMLQKSGKPLILAVNKVDQTGALPLGFYEFYELGLEGEPLAVSSIHGTGSGDILDRILELIPDTEPEEPETDIIRVAVIGKPNSGKSSLINTILGEERMIVSDVPGTTRDAVDARIENEYGKYIFVDTAGIRRRSRIEDKIEKYSVLRAETAVENADVCLIMIDAAEGITEQDEKIAGLAHEAGKASVFVLNKWDLVEKDNDTVNKYTADVYNAFSYMTYAPVLFISARTGRRVDKLFDYINEVYAESAKRITTGMLNDILNDATTRVQPPANKGRRLKIYYMTQTGIKPPSFIIFCNDPELFHFSYQRYIENCIRGVFGFKGTPVRIIVRGRGE